MLLIDEAYYLAEGNYAKEAVDEIVNLITKPEFAKRLIIILAGYDNDISRLTSINLGLTSGFPEFLQFNKLSPDNCITLLMQLLQRQKSKLKKNTVFDITILEFLELDFWEELCEHFSTLSESPNWANARDVRLLGSEAYL